MGKAYEDLMKRPNRKTHVANYVDKNNCTRRIRDGKGWEGTGKPSESLGGCNFRKGKYLAFCR